jgi:hypothetical protein
MDLFSQQLSDWFNSLFNRIQGGFVGGPALIIVIVAVLVVAAIVVGFFVFGAPRLNRRSAGTGAVFGDEDDRDSSALLRAAERAASAGDFATAIEEGFRALARGLSERLVVTTFPGTTAHGFALEAAEAFPDSRGDLASAANTFDGVRYLGASGTEANWLAIRTLEADLRASRPVHAEQGA